MEKSAQETVEAGGGKQTDESGAILSRSRQVLRAAEDAGCEDGLSPDSVPPADGLAEPDDGLADPAEEVKADGLPKDQSVQTWCAKALPLDLCGKSALEGPCRREEMSI